MLDSQTFKQHLAGLVEQSANPVSFSAARFIVAYSGGLDSHVLLHLCRQAGLNCRAVYIDHGLQSESANWGEHCRAVCENLAIPFDVIAVDAAARRGESPEASARGARYRALASVMQPNDNLLTAQHLQDQAETFFLQLLRTAGPAGLAAMPAVKPFAAGYHLRPLLGTSREELEDYAAQYQLSWIEDPSNTDQRFDRNFLRHSIMPVLQNRWPSINRVIANSCQLQAEASELIQQLAQIDAARVIEEQRVNITALLQLNAVRQRNLLRYWLQQLGLDIPPATRLSQILDSMIHAADDAIPEISWMQTEVRRFQGQLYAFKRLSAVDPTSSWAWNGVEAMPLEGLNQQISLQPAEQGLSADIIGRDLSVRLRCGGEKIKPVGRAHTKDLKKLMQEAAVPPWQRGRLPLLFLDDQLIAVANYWIDDAFKNQPGKSALKFVSDLI